MALRMDIVQRGEKFDDGDSRYKWNWHWLDKVISVKMSPDDSKEVEVRYGEWLRKLRGYGHAYCELCRKEIMYASRGSAQLDKHVGSAGHLDRMRDRRLNPTLPGKSRSKTTPYGIHPALASSVTVEKTELEPLTPLDDRIRNMEAMTVAFLAENNMPYTAAPKLLDFSKALAKDKPALSHLKMDRTTASYKLKFGLAKTFQEEIVEELKASPFSLNIDEAMSKTNEKVLAVLVSHFSPSLNRIVVHHLTAISLVKVSSLSLYTEIEKLMEKLELPWENLQSVLMDSCSVMRGDKSGLEKRIRVKAQHLLDIDGDSCHHAHNAAKTFCKPFTNATEGLLNDVHIEFHWSTEQKYFFFQLCVVLGIKPTKPEKYVGHRWLSVLDVAADTLRLLDALILYTASFLRPKDVGDYQDLSDEIIQRRNVSETGKNSIIKIQESLRNKWTSYTKDGKDRKLRLVEKLLLQYKKTCFLLNTYCSVLPILKKYILFFQKREPVIHRLHDKQEELLLEFLSCYIRPEALSKGNPKNINVNKEANQLAVADMFVGEKAKNFLHQMPSDEKKKILLVLQEAYKSCGSYLIKKMPIDNVVLKICSVLDPAMRGTIVAQKLLLELPKQTNLVPQCKMESFELEVRKYNVDRNLNASNSAVPIDEWWASVSSETYPLLTKAAKGILSCFHGPIVESSFSVMGELLNEKMAQTDIESYAAMQTVKTSLAARKTTAVEYFEKKDPLKEPVSKKLVQNMKKAWEENELRKSSNRQTKESTSHLLGGQKNILPSKVSEKKKLYTEASRAKEQHAALCSAGKRKATPACSNYEPALKHQKISTSVCTQEAASSTNSNSNHQPLAIDESDVHEPAPKRQKISTSVCMQEAASSTNSNSNHQPLAIDESDVHEPAPKRQKISTSVCMQEAASSTNSNSNHQSLAIDEPDVLLVQNKIKPKQSRLESFFGKKI